ncbi:TetR/AcrR family transcriptional regulator [Allorhizobium sp. BGMRC 0089]|uniref:TetR/AcrR family transcriptional regulator n=1 Tax=Allorhizobium sonneratiae TaxID=2934936 RepID=UPI002034491B|nr:TetR/AcrR family transcriptional regulator [Allorhizobium sonneratiae]MCM2292553.1 TetR/AcrR family transcriptional regulator [Allorhizobium sonneratiae]
MSIAERKERQRAERYELILAAARELAEAEGWDAVTTRRLADLINYSQPVLYSHFKGKAEIMAAVATRGFEELAGRLEAETRHVAGGILRNVCAAYIDFARSSPIVYEAMFVLPTNIKFASDETPPALRAAFAALVAALGPNRRDPVFLAEVLWGALHGLVVLTQSGRIPASGAETRLDILVAKFSDEAHAGDCTVEPAAVTSPTKLERQ